VDSKEGISQEKIYKISYKRLTESVIDFYGNHCKESEKVGFLLRYPPLEAIISKMNNEKREE
jgi:hypothetical protein